MNEQNRFIGDAEMAWEDCKNKVLDILSKYIKNPPYDKLDTSQPVLKEIKERIEKL